MRITEILKVILIPLLVLIAALERISGGSRVDCGSGMEWLDAAPQALERRLAWRCRRIDPGVPGDYFLFLLVASLAARKQFPVAVVSPGAPQPATH